jgi:succinyl-diaminopimelate desuccinylase
MTLDLSVDVVELTRALIDIESVSRNEQTIADTVEQTLRSLPHLTVERIGNTLVARTELGHAERVVIAGHLDTVPVNDNLPSRLDGHAVRGLGACDMKGGDAVILKVAALGSYNRDVTLVLYDCEEIDAAANGLNKLSQSRPELLQGDLAILMEPSNAGVEAGCQGTMRVRVTTRGVRAHSARSWVGVNAIHGAAPILAKLAAFEPRQPVIDGLRFHEGLNAVFIEGGVAGNVVPDACTVTVNYRFAPDRSEADAEAFLRDFFDGYEVEVTDTAPGALPGLGRPAVKAFVALTDAEPQPKLGWTDVARFTALGIPAINFGPGDPLLAHTRDEYVPTAHLTACEDVMKEWLRA